MSIDRAYWDGVVAIDTNVDRAFGSASSVINMVSGGTWKTTNGLAVASIKTVNGLAKASIKSYDGLTP